MLQRLSLEETFLLCFCLIGGICLQRRLLQGGDKLNIWAPWQQSAIATAMLLAVHPVRCVCLVGFADLQLFSEAVYVSYRCFMLFPSSMCFHASPLSCPSAMSPALRPRSSCTAQCLASCPNRMWHGHQRPVWNVEHDGMKV